jgi:hypothetical protein
MFFGTDAVAGTHGPNAEELIYRVESWLEIFRIRLINL